MDFKTGRKCRRKTYRHNYLASMPLSAHQFFLLPKNTWGLHHSNTIRYFIPHANAFVALYYEQKQLLYIINTTNMISTGPWRESTETQFEADHGTTYTKNAAVPTTAVYETMSDLTASERAIGLRINITRVCTLSN